jgi:stress response protein YsnF
MGEDDAGRRGYRSDSTASTTRVDTDSSDVRTRARDIDADQGEVAIPVVEEEIRVGKREVDSGGVRVETRVEETPINEQVTLHDEKVTVDRRPVNQDVDPSTVTDAFREGTFEVRGHSEEAVVQKEARVVEEVVVNKQVDERTEQIQDTARRTDVDVQQIPGQTPTSGYTETTDVSSRSRTDTTPGMDSTMSDTRSADSPRSEWDESSKVGTAGGALAGGATGAAIGSAGGPVGTVVGGVAGAVTGAGVGAAGDAAGEAASDATMGEDDTSTGSRTDEGAIERGMSRGGNALERGSGLDLDRDGDTGKRDPRNNF